MGFTFNNREFVVNVDIEQVNAGLTSSPTSGKCKVTNIVFDPTTGDTDVEYNDIPEE